MSPLHGDESTDAENIDVPDPHTLQAALNRAVPASRHRVATIARIRPPTLAPTHSPDDRGRALISRDGGIRTRLQGLSAFTGRASKSIRQHLARHGARIAASPESFLVEGLTGALAVGELERARCWGERLTRSDCLRGAAGRGQAP